MSENIMQDSFSLDEARSMAIMHNGEIFKYFDEGCTRYVYINESETKVIKIDKNKHSNKWNEEEIDCFKNASDDDKRLMVKTRIINGLIEQDFVTPIKYGGKRLSIEQRLFASSCRNEVGWTEDGKLLCFDLDEFKKY